MHFQKEYEHLADVVHVLLNSRCFQFAYDGMAVLMCLNHIHVVCMSCTA